LISRQSGIQGSKDASMFLPLPPLPWEPSNSTLYVFVSKQLPSPLLDMSSEYSIHIRGTSAVLHSSQSQTGLTILNVRMNTYVMLRTSLLPPPYKVPHLPTDHGQYNKSEQQSTSEIHGGWKHVRGGFPLGTLSAKSESGS